jgi:hypothetical protein
MIRARARRLPRYSHAMPKRGCWRNRIEALVRDRAGHRISATVSMKIEQMVEAAALWAMFGGS